MVVISLIGAALLYGDGTITPAISVLSAIEGVEVEHLGDPVQRQPYRGVQYYWNTTEIRNQHGGAR